MALQSPFTASCTFDMPMTNEFSHFLFYCSETHQFSQGTPKKLKFEGVHKDGEHAFRARVFVNGRDVACGTFPLEEQAGRAADRGLLCVW